MLISNKFIIWLVLGDTTVCLVCLYFGHIDTQCVTLTTTDDLIMSCYNGSTYTTGEGYVGDTCSFTCNTGYMLTGSDTRTCQSDGSWTGEEARCTKGG